MPNTQFEIVELKSGIKSLRLIENNETFHPGIGPLAEANILHVDQHNLLARSEAAEAAGDKFILWDVGLGAGANAVAAIDALKDSCAEVEIHSFDRSLGALEFALNNLDDLDYLAPHQDATREFLKARTLALTPRLTWILHLGDFREQMLNPDIPSPHSIFYDPYSPRGNVDMWNLEHFTALRERLDDSRPCIISNYTRSTYVRVTWLLAGFYVGIGTAIGQKEETSLASNVLSELARPLPETWMRRVQISHSSAPLRGPVYNVGPIAPADLKAVQDHPQFRSFHS